MSCKVCGAPDEGTPQCGYCGTLSQGPPRPGLIVRADFSGSQVGGWRVGERLEGRPLQGPPPGWSLTQQPQEQNHPLLIAPGCYDDFEVHLTYRLIATQPRDSFFLRSRGAPGGAMVLQVWCDGSLSLTWQKPDHQWQDSLCHGMAPSPLHRLGWRRLRWRAEGSRHRVYQDDQLLLSARHEEIVHTGYLDLRLQALQRPVTLELCQLALYEA